MANVDVTKIRNIGIVGHGGAGKTSLTEAILFGAGVTDRQGRVEDGNTVTDFEPEEIGRQISISTALAFVEKDGYRYNLMDTPGYANFIEDTKGTMSAMDAALIVFPAQGGLKAETMKVWQFSEKYRLPCMLFIGGMDKDMADFSAAATEVEAAYGTPVALLQLPIGAAGSFSGIVDLVRMKAYSWEGGKSQEKEIPDDLKAQAEEYRGNLVERVAETDDALIEKYLEGGELTDQEITDGIRNGIINRKFLPVVCGSSVKGAGMDLLLDSIQQFLPSPADTAAVNPMIGKSVKDGSDVERKPEPGEPLSVRVFKTLADPFAGRITLFRVYSGVLKADSNVLNTSRDAKERVGQVFYMQGKKHIATPQAGPGEIAAVAKLKSTLTGDTLSGDNGAVVLPGIDFSEPIISYAIAPKNKGDEDKVSSGLHRILDEDPTVRFHFDEETKEMILAGMGQLHLEVTLERLKRKFGTEVEMKTPQIAYRETIKGATKVQGKYKKQSGGRGQYGDCWLEFEPLPRNGGFEFVDKIVGGSIPRQYIPAVEKGLLESIKDGVLAGYPTVDIRATVYDGSYHDVDSSEMAFKIAASMAFKKAIPQAQPILLEPIMLLETTTPDEFLGAVIGDINSRRGRVQGVDAGAGGSQKISAMVPMSEVLTYANQLTSMTSGRGMYSMEFSHYEEVPAHIAQKIVETRAKQRGKETEE